MEPLNRIGCAVPDTAMVQPSAYNTSAAGVALGAINAVGGRAAG